MLTFTLDTNCLIDIDEARPDSTAIRALADAHARSEANVAVVAIIASEKQKSGERLTNFNQFRARLDSLQLGHLDILKPMLYWDVGFWDWAYWTGAEMVGLERKIHDVLFPNIEFQWSDFCRTMGWDSNSNSVDAKWRNAKCDVQALWSHIHHRRDVFVTSDTKFHAVTKLPTLITLGAGQIVTPQSAVAMLKQAANAV
jgi:hypothetical protein